VLLLLPLLLLLLVPLGEINPRWWWRWWLRWRRTRWWWWRRTDAPLRALGLGASLLGPASSPLTLLGGSATNDSSAWRSRRRLSSSDPPVPPRAEEPLAAPLPLSKGRGTAVGALAATAGTLGAAPAGWGGLQSMHQRFGSHGGGPGRRSGEPPHRSRRGLAAWPRSPSSTLDCRREQGCPGEDQGIKNEGVTSNPLH
jgi:hypothetical protein